MITSNFTLNPTSHRKISEQPNISRLRLGYPGPGPSWGRGLPGSALGSAAGSGFTGPEEFLSCSQTSRCFIVVFRVSIVYYYFIISLHHLWFHVAEPYTQEVKGQSSFTFIKPDKLMKSYDLFSL